MINDMKKIIPAIVLIFTVYSYSDTISYITSSCLVSLTDQADAYDTLERAFLLQNDTLTISGRIYANCCGAHLMKVDIAGDSVVNLYGIDTGDMCDCICTYDFMIKIHGCTSEYYHILLSKYAYDYIDTIIYKSTSIVRNNDFIRGSDIKVYNSAAASKAVFDIKGRRVKTDALLRSHGLYIDKTGKFYNPVIYW
jgi:hypothetical protein